MAPTASRPTSGCRGTACLSSSTTRLTPEGREVATLSAAELSAAAGYPVPTLDQALERFPDIFWNVEIKSPAAVAITLDRIRPGPQAGARWEGVFSSAPSGTPWSSPSLASPGGRVRPPPRLPAGELRCRRLPLPPGRQHPHRRLELTRPSIPPPGAGRALGFRSYVYGVETAEEHRHCAELPLAGVITDHLDRLRPDA